MTWIADPEIWIALVTLTFLEIVLGVDNVVFISILSGRLPAAEQPRARRLGLLGAMVTRIALLFSITWMMRLTAPLFAVLGREISGRDLILIAGGLFLLAKSTYEIHDKLEGDVGGRPVKARATRTAPVVASDPFLPKRTISAHGTVRETSSATSTSRGCGREKREPLSSCARTAASTSGSRWPRMIGPRASGKSTYSLPSTSQKRQPSAF